MPETIDAVKHPDDSCSTHASAFASWIATKTKENDARKALMTGSKEQNSAYNRSMLERSLSRHNRCGG